jgi:hypothetical protein
VADAVKSALLVRLFQVVLAARLWPQLGNSEPCTNEEHK